MSVLRPHIECRRWRVLPMGAWTLLLVGAVGSSAWGLVDAAAGATSQDGAPNSCHQIGTGDFVLPDPVCTPGTTNVAVSQANTGSTICRHGWTATVRPPVAYTESLKTQQMVAYGDNGPKSRYEEDHLIPLELGGSPTDPRNLWPEPSASPNLKDKVERAANRAVCRGSMTLSAAQRAISSNWVAFGVLLGVVALPFVPRTTGPAPPTTAEVGGPTTVAAPPPTGANGCSPLSSTGNCYKPGQLCSNADHGLTGVGAGNQPIKCEDDDGWRWVGA